ncbi:MAG: hypothetical protein HY318_05530, partial [Armatimonadetes bacterium]|nr:hypothetical protein [Armatimonadota bacterium]
MRGLLALCLLIPSVEAFAVEGVECLDYRGYKNCYRLFNSVASVIVVPESGGRVLAYSLGGRNVLYENRENDGKSFATEGNKSWEPDGGRFDIGPEITIPRHPSLWIGPYQAKVLSSRSVRLTSEKDSATGCQIIRDFTLEKNSSQLKVTQKLVNISTRPVEWCFWSRTFARSGGVCVIPINPFSRFPQGWGQYGKGGLVQNPEKQEKVEVREGCLTLTTAPKIPKYGIDSYAGWLAYAVDGLLFAKRFPVQADGYYKDGAGFTIEIWITPEVTELEPLSVAKRLKPGESFSFTEDWWLMEYPVKDNA